MAEVRMDYDAVYAVAGGFAEAAQRLQALSQSLEVLIRAAQVATFITLGATRALERYLSNIKPRVDRLAATCEEMAMDLRIAVREHIMADTGAAGQFNDGGSGGGISSGAFTPFSFEGGVNVGAGDLTGDGATDSDTDVDVDDLWRGEAPDMVPSASAGGQSPDGITGAEAASGPQPAESADVIAAPGSGAPGDAGGSGGAGGGGGGGGGSGGSGGGAGGSGGTSNASPAPGAQGLGSSSPAFDANKPAGEGAVGGGKTGGEAGVTGGGSIGGDQGGNVGAGLGVAAGVIGVGGAAAAASGAGGGKGGSQQADPDESEQFAS